MGRLWLGTVVALGLLVSGVSGYWLLVDWRALSLAYDRYDAVIATQGSDRDLEVAQTAELRHRINCFAEGVGVLLGGVITAIGVHGWVTLDSTRGDRS